MKEDADRRPKEQTATAKHQGGTDCCRHRYFGGFLHGTVNLGANVEVGETQWLRDTMPAEAWIVFFPPTWLPCCSCKAALLESPCILNGRDLPALRARLMTLLKLQATTIEQLVLCWCLQATYGACLQEVLFLFPAELPWMLLPCANETFLWKTKVCRVWSETRFKKYWVLFIWSAAKENTHSVKRSSQPSAYLEQDGA